MNVKILLFVIIALAAGFAAGYYFHQCDDGPEIPAPDKKTTANSQQLTIEEVASTDPMETRKFGQPITFAEAKLMYDTYSNEWVRGRNYRTRSLWFSYHEIADYLKHVDEEIEADTSNIGIRFYFGAKDKNIQGYKYRLTMFMVPTFGKGAMKRDTLSRPMKIIGGYNHGDLCPPETTCGESAFERPNP